MDRHGSLTVAPGSNQLSPTESPALTRSGRFPPHQRGCAADPPRRFWSCRALLHTGGIVLLVFSRSHSIKLYLSCAPSSFKDRSFSRSCTVFVCRETCTALVPPGCFHNLSARVELPRCRNHLSAQPATNGNPRSLSGLILA